MLLLLIVLLCYEHIQAEMYLFIYLLYAQATRYFVKWKMEKQPVVDIKYYMEINQMFSKPLEAINHLQGIWSS